MTKTIPIHGYRPITSEVATLANINKTLEELTMRQMDKLTSPDNIDLIDPRLLAIARTHLQTAFMYMNRALFQPGRVEGPLDLNGAIKELAQ
jgi:hypothetical protein